jgi:MraZ protein
MIQLFGVHDQKVDNKGRVLFPSALKRQLMNVLQDGFVIKRSTFGNYLVLYPMPEWNKEMKVINKLNRFIKKNNDFITGFMDGVRIVELDDAGRILIPKELLQWAEIDKEVVVASSINRIDIWAKDKYEKHLENTRAGFEALAEDVMGNINPDEE